MQGIENEIEAHLAYFWNKLCTINKGLDNIVCPRIIINKRLRTTAGRAFDDAPEIDLAYKFILQNPVYMYNVILPHELCHYVNRVLFPDSHYSTKHGHDKQWCNLMVSIGLKPERYHSLKTR